jgi:hypothetical protein
MKCEKCNEKAVAHGLCRNHYQQKRYKENEKVREGIKLYGKKYSKIYRKRKLAEDPTYFARVSKRYRKRHPKRYIYHTAKCLFKKLSPEDRSKLIYELNTNNKEK